MRGYMRIGSLAVAVALAAVIGVGCGSGAAPAETPPAASAAQVIKSARPSIVRIDVSTCDAEGNGSGFVVAPGLVATAAHVVEGASSLSITPEGASAVSATVVGSDSTRDVALIRADGALSANALDFAPEAEPEVGADVVVLGYPLGLPFTATQGAITGLGRDLTIESTGYKGLFQTDAAVNPGNSGGAIIDRKGQVVGIVVAGGEGFEGIGFGVPASGAKSTLDGWTASPSPQPLADCTGSAPTSDPVESASPDSSSPAATSDGSSFESPTGNIHCMDNDTELYCTTSNDGYAVVLPSDGEPESAYQDQTVPGGEVVPYGSTWSAPSGNFECDVSEDGVTCRNLYGSGFFLNRDSYEPL